MLFPAMLLLLASVSQASGAPNNKEPLPDVEERGMGSLTDANASAESKLSTSGDLEVPKAIPIELDEPVVDASKEDVSNTFTQPSQQPLNKGTAAANSGESQEAGLASAGQTKELASKIILGIEVEPATATRLSWSPSQSLEGIATPIPILVVNGAKPGPTLCLTSAIHGDELNGIEIVRPCSLQYRCSGIIGNSPLVCLSSICKASTAALVI